MKHKNGRMKEGRHRKLSAFNDVMTMSRSKTRAERIADKIQAEKDFDRHEKRIKFRAMAMEFIEWRARRPKSRKSP